MPREPRFDQSQRHIRPVDFDSGHEAAVTIPLLTFDTNLLAEDEVRSELLRSLGEVRAVLWTSIPSRRIRVCSRPS